MVCSMTAFARSEQETELGVMSWELRAVNHRYLEISVRLPEELRAIEGSVRERINARLGRGKVDCAFRFKPSAAAGPVLSLNRDLVRDLVALTREIDDMLSHSPWNSALDVLRWPGVLEAREANQEQVKVEALALLAGALSDMYDGRRREGEKLKAIILQRCDAMGVLVDDARDRLPRVVQLYRQRLLERVNAVRQELDPQRLEQEIVLAAQKMDVHEELDRIEVHIDEVRRVIEQPGPVGRRLDFLMQEFNREANTLGAKSVDVETTRISVDMKVLIEQMREQIQNIE